LNASKNELSDAALAVVAGQTNAPIMSGVKGASIDRVEQNGFSIYISQAKFEIPTDMSVFASSRHEISNNTRPRDQAGVALPPVDGTDTTSVMGSKVATEKEVSLTITETTPSSHAQGTLTSSATVIKLAERQTMPPPPTIEEYPAAFRDMTDGTTIAYTEALTLLRKYNPSSKLREHRKPLQIQKQVILYRSREIQNVLSKSAGNNMRSNELLKAACDRIHKRLSELQDWLRLLPSYVGSKPCDDGQVTSSALL
jgi:hypothetical protein